MGKVYFLFGVHDHQPVGNFDHVFEEAYNRCYFPFLKVLENHPFVKCNLHISGPLYDWLLSNHKELIDRIKLMVKRGQLEVMSGGYYEPILPIIPDDDKVLQISLMNDFIRKHFNTEPKGIWVAERVWEPYLARVINKASLEYTFLDDTHFRYAGMTEKELLGYYATEDSGQGIYVFPISKTLRYKIPFSKAIEAITFLKSFVQEKDVLITLFDDGEKFGLWPHTYEWVYTKGWLEKFFELLTKNTDTIQTIRAKDAMDKFKPKGPVYLPAASYEEMGEWVLTPGNFGIYDDLKEYIKKSTRQFEFNNFVRGGFFRNFFAKYPRLNFMHKKMISLSKKIHSAKSLKNKKNILKHLLMAQCNCGYWHGIFGGFYLGHIRGAIYDNLIKAESELDKKTLKKPLGVERYDLDFDGYKETVIKNKHLIVVFSDRGGSIVELSYKDRNFNLLNTITRREESYHSKIKENIKSDNSKLATIHDMAVSKEANLDKYLIYDNYEKLSLVDHLLDRDITLDDFIKQKKVKTLSNNIYNFLLIKKSPAVILQYSCTDDNMELLKNITVGENAAFSAEYKISGTGGLDNYCFGVEFNLFLASPKDITFAVAGRKESFSGEKAFRDISSFIVIDGLKKTSVEFIVDKADIFAVPLYSVSSSESGFEKVYQQITLLFIKRTKGDSFSINCKLKKEG